MFRKSWIDNSVAVEGKACFFINSAMFLGQSVTVLITGPIIGVAKTSTAAITIGCIAGAIGLVFTRLCKTLPTTKIETKETKINNY